jgi:hypothetical protein
VTIGRPATPGGRYRTSRPPSWTGTSYRVIYTEDRESGRPTMTTSDVLFPVDDDELEADHDSGGLFGVPA